MKKVPLKLLQKYDKPGPRYTSYPPATHFQEDFSLPQNLLPSGALSLYFHLPFCARQCLYCGCTNLVTTNPNAAPNYLKLLQEELRLRPVDSASKVVQIQLGGGTPTFLQPKEIEQLGHLIQSHFSVAEKVEAGVEIDPRTLTLEKAKALRAAGFNRASLGIQDTHPGVQKRIGRIQPLEQIAEANQCLRQVGFESINFDLVYGLPAQTPQSFEQTLNETVQLNPDRLAIYSYAHIPWIKPAQKVLEPFLPPPETKLILLQLAIEQLDAAGYLYVGMDHFAKPTDPLARALESGTLQRNFQGYSTHRGAELLGFGMSAISFHNGTYLQNQKTLESYSESLQQKKRPLFRGYITTPEDQIRHAAITQIMCRTFVDYATFHAETGIDFAEKFASELLHLSDLEADGLLLREKNGLRITPLGRLFLRIIAMRFDPYLSLEKNSPTPRYSQTV
jgi:oxygen-independent coproporphyrinogen-3 oxidase